MVVVYSHTALRMESLAIRRLLSGINPAVQYAQSQHAHKFTRICDRAQDHTSHPNVHMLIVYATQRTDLREQSVLKSLRRGLVRCSAHLSPCFHRKLHCESTPSTSQSLPPILAAASLLPPRLTCGQKGCERKNTEKGLKHERWIKKKRKT
jgi:hypothetical protein